MGRFLSVDPEEGGSANDYDYVAGDPINTLDLDGHGWFSRLVQAVTRVAEVVSWVPGPIGAIASGVAAAGNAIQGNWGAAAVFAFGAVTGGLGTNAVRAVKAARRFSGRIDGVRQAGHIRGTAEYVNRMKTRSRKENSVFHFGRRWANFHTRLGAAFGKPGRKQRHIRKLRLPYPVGRSRSGKRQWTVRVSTGKKGMHGSPWH